MCEPNAVDNEKLIDAVRRLEAYIEREQYRGYDPYDVLMSPLFRLPVFRSSKLLRFGSQQFFRRIPINLRPFLGIKKGYNPVALGCCIQGYAYRIAAATSSDITYRSKADALVNELERLQSPGYTGACWGYDFDWEGRYAKISARVPTVVATGFITNALFEYYRVTKDERSLALCRSAANFVLNDLHREHDGDTFCFSYSPGDKQRVLNASMKGARLLIQVHSVCPSEVLVKAARQAVDFVVKRQRANGSWVYSDGDARTWSDNYHTAYVLDALKEYIDTTGDDRHREALAKGYAYYRLNFFDGSIPKYYDRRRYPIDATAIAQSIITLTRFGDISQAKMVANWAIDQMMDQEGFVYYQKTRWYTHRTSYMRWSNAWMYCALTYLLSRFVL